MGVMEGLTLADLAGQSLERCEADGVLPPILRLLEEGKGQRGTAASGKGRRGDSEPEYLI
jgi:hypothetical protein